MDPNPVEVDEFAQNLTFDEGAAAELTKGNFDENPDEYVPEAGRHEYVKPIFPNQKRVSPTDVANREAHKAKVVAQRRFKNKQARAARRKNRR